MITVECIHCWEQFEVETLDEPLPRHRDDETQEICIGSGRRGQEVDLDADFAEFDDPDDNEEDGLEQ